MMSATNSPATGPVSPPPPVMPPPLYGAPMPPPGWMPPPPQFYPAPPPPRRGGGFARGVLITFATIIFGLSIWLNIYLLMISGLAGGAGGSIETALTRGEADQGIAVVPVEGLIDSEIATQVTRWMKEIENDSDIKGLVLQVETPGGYVTASDEIHYRLGELKKKREEKSGKKFPIAVSMGGMATSGGYYVSAGADQIFAQPTTLTGNIGVLMPRYNLKGLADKWGISESTITAPEKGFKNAGSFLSPESAEEREYLQGLINQSYTRFTSIVDAGRSGKLKAPRTEIYDGRAFSTREALKNGLIDQEGYLDDAYRWVASAAGLNKPSVIRYQRKLGLLDLMSARSPVPGMESRGVDVNLKLDADVLHELTAPRLMYLWRGE